MLDLKASKIFKKKKNPLDDHLIVLQQLIGARPVHQTSLSEKKADSPINILRGGADKLADWLADGQR